MPIVRADPDEHTGRPKTVRAIHPNAGTEAWYYRALHNLIAQMTVEVERGVLGVYGSLEPQEMAHDAPPRYPFEVFYKGMSAGERSTREGAEQLRARVVKFGRGKIAEADVEIVEKRIAPAAAAATVRNPSLLIKAALRKWGGLWVSKFDKLSLDLAQEFAKRSFAMTQAQMRAALKDAGFTVRFAPTPGSRSAYQGVVAEQVNLIKSIPAEYLKAVESKVWNSVMVGGDMHALATDLRATYGITRDRAALIARDQNNKAKATIERARRQELGITHAIWQHSAGGKVPRATHVAMSGKAYKIAEGMYDSAVGQYVLPGELINCRCTSRAVIPAFETVASAERGARETPYLRAARGRAR